APWIVIVTPLAGSVVLVWLYRNATVKFESTGSRLVEKMLRAWLTAAVVTVAEVSALMTAPPLAVKLAAVNPLMTPGVANPARARVAVPRVIGPVPRVPGMSPVTLPPVTVRPPEYGLALENEVVPPVTTTAPAADPFWIFPR